MINPTCRYDFGARMRVESRCPLCEEESSLILQKRTATVHVNGWIPLGTYREVQAACTRCEKEYLIAPDLSKALTPGKVEKRLFVGAWLALPVPIVNTILMGWVLQRSPVTSNAIRNWAKIGMVPSTLITLGFVGYLICL